MGTENPDWADPRAEGEAIAAAMPAGLGTVMTVSGAGHYPQAQCPDQVAALVTRFCPSTRMPDPSIASATADRRHSGA